VNAADEPVADRRYDAVVLAGGRARRFGGADKPGLTVGGRTLAEAVVSAAAGAAMIIVVGPERGYLRRIGPAGAPRPRFVREDPPGGGPVAALRRGITEVSARWLVLLAADLPFVLPEHVHALLAAAGEARAASAGRRAGAILVDDDGRPQWLIGCWPTATLAGALQAYGGRSLHGLLSPMRPAELLVKVAPSAPPPWLDCDSPVDLRLAREWADRCEHSRAGR
jgi:molybdopterin-guanine dinucleotide biosynthesis protein A